MADCTLPQLWQPAALTTTTPMATLPQMAVTAAATPSSFAATTAAGASSGSNTSLWLLAGLGVVALLLSGKDAGLSGTDDSPAPLNGPRRHKPRTAPRPAAAPVRPSRPRTHGHHVAHLVIS